MRIPKDFKATIDRIFYDKTINIFTSSITKDNEGWAKRYDNVSTSSFTGNINFSKLDKVQQDYGIEDDIDAVITTNDNIANNTIIGYLDRKYKIIRNIPFDSHYLLIVQKWSSKSST